MEHNEYSGTGLYMGGRRWARRFVSLEKDNLLFQPPAHSGSGFEEAGS
jgi:hypothetical protein